VIPSSAVAAASAASLSTVTNDTDGDSAETIHAAPTPQPRPDLAGARPPALRRERVQEPTGRVAARAREPEPVGERLRAPDERGIVRHAAI
jgi:hypothetical protein